MSIDESSFKRDALELRARPNPTSALSAVGTLAWRAMLKIKHVPFQLFDVTVTPIMFTLLFTYMFGGALAGSPKVYIQFTFASNIFVRIETMPTWLQTIVRHNPVTHLTDASRGLMHGTDAAADVVWVLAASALIVMVSAPIAMRMYHRER